MARTYALSSRIHLDAPLDRVFPFFARAENLELLTPPFLRFEVTSPTPVAMRAGAAIDYRLSVHGVPMRWRSEIPIWDPPFRFADRQVEGPYRLWEHEHRFEETESGTVCTDEVRFQVPFSAVAYPLFVRRDLTRIFGFRRRILVELFGEVGPPGPGPDLSIELLPESRGGELARDLELLPSARSVGRRVGSRPE